MFDWHNKKLQINTSKDLKLPNFQQREIWFCYLGLNIRFEQNGSVENFLRPVLILKKFNNRLFFGIPLTTTIKKNKNFYFEFSYIENKRSIAILSQLRIMDSKRLSYFSGYIKKEDFQIIKEKLHKLIM